MTPIAWDPNGVNWPHEPKCPVCLRFEADCRCLEPVEPEEEVPADA